MPVNIARVAAPLSKSRQLSRLVSSQTAFARQKTITTTTPSIIATSNKPFTTKTTDSVTISKDVSIQDKATSFESRLLRKFDISDRVLIVTGGGRGLGHTIAVDLAELGSHVYCLDINEQPSEEFVEAQQRISERGSGSIHYRQLDVRDQEAAESVVQAIVKERGVLHGLVAAAGVNSVIPSLKMTPAEGRRVMDINYWGVWNIGNACARQMIATHTPGTIVIIGSMSAFIANRGLECAVYNSSKAAVVQLTRNWAMEWREAVGGKPIRVNVICPGNILTPMVRQNFADDPSLEPLWKANNMLNRISEPHEYTAAVLYQLSDASSFKTGSADIIDGGYTAW